MDIGQTTTYKKTFTQAEFDLFAKLSGDDNPIHVDPEFSARTKFGKTVAHGMLLYSTIARCLETHLPGSQQISQELMFPNPTFVDQPLTFQLEVIATPTSDTVEISTDVIQPDGNPGCTGKSLVSLPGSNNREHLIAFEVEDYSGGAQAHRGLEVAQKASSTRLFSQSDLVSFKELLENKNIDKGDFGYAHFSETQDTPIPAGLLGGTVSDLLGTELPGRGTNWLKQKYYFGVPACPGDEITTTVEIIRLRPEKDLVNLRTTISNQRGETNLDGEALVWVSDLE